MIQGRFNGTFFYKHQQIPIRFETTSYHEINKTVNLTKKTRIYLNCINMHTLHASIQDKFHYHLLSSVYVSNPMHRLYVQSRQKY